MANFTWGPVLGTQARIRARFCAIDGVAGRYMMWAMKERLIGDDAVDGLAYFSRFTKPREYNETDVLEDFGGPTPYAMPLVAFEETLGSPAARIEGIRRLCIATRKRTWKRLRLFSRIVA